MKVYLVEADFDQWEDSYQVSLGLFKHKSKAELVKQNYEQDIKKLRTKDLLDQIEEKEEEDLIGWEQWKDFNFCTITEYELNEEES
jgi:hypothetical protein